MEAEEKIIARLKPGCICMGIRLHCLIKAIEEGAADFAEVAARTGIGRGDCGGRRCGAKVAELLAARKKTEEEQG